MQKEGKSFLSSYLGNYYCCIGKKVLIIELDPHSEDVSQTPLEHFLRADGAIESLILPGKPDRIKLDSSQPFMKELLKTQKMAELMHSLKQTYDLILSLTLLESLKRSMPQTLLNWLISPFL